MATQGQILPTMGAVVFGNQTQDLLPNAIRQQEQRRLLEAQQRQKEAQAMADSWRNNSLKASQGMLWNDEFAQVEQAHLNEGLNLQSRGIDPYTSMNPQAVKYREKQARIQAMQGARQGLEKQYVSINNIIQKDPNKFRSEDVKALQDFVSGKTFEDVYKQGLQLPQVRQRFNVQDAIKGSAVPFTTVEVKDGVETEVQGVDADASKRVILARLNSAPDGQEYLTSITNGFSVPELMNGPNDIDGVKNLLGNFYDSNEEFRTQLANQMRIAGRDTPEYEAFANEYAQRFISGKNNLNNFLDQSVEQVSGGQRVVNKSKPNTKEEDQRMKREKHEWQRQLKNKRLSEGNDSDVGVFNPNSYEEIAYGDDVSPVQQQSPMYGFTKVNSSNVSFVGNGIIDLETGQKIQDRPIQNGKAVAFSVQPVDSRTGALLNKNQIKNNPNVKYESFALVSSEEKRTSGSIDKDYLVPTRLLPDKITKTKAFKDFNNWSKTMTGQGQQSSGNAPAKTQSTKTKITW